MRTVAVLGSTGSVGDSTLKILPELAHSHRVTALVARRNAADLVAQARALRPQVIGLVEPDAAAAAERELRGEGIDVVGGPDAAVLALQAARPDVVVAAITGAAGLASTIEAVTSGATLALANKEAMVMAGHLITRYAAESGSAIVPVDSEHSAVFQAIHGEPARHVRRVFLTASGGPFADHPLDQFADITPEQALRHPTWDMGRKITIDSATMMNKALEIVEAHWLFGLDADAISVLVHRQSIVHSMVEFIDGSILAQLGVPCMTVPVRYALAYPERALTERNYFDVERFAELTFTTPDHVRFPSLDLGYQVVRQGGLAGTALNAANEVAVDRFLARALRFDQIPEVAGRVLDRLDDVSDPDLEQILATDRWARKEAEACLTS